MQRPIYHQRVRAGGSGGRRRGCKQRVRNGWQKVQAVRLLEMRLLARRGCNQWVRVVRQWELAVRLLGRRMCNRRMLDGQHWEQAVRLQRCVRAIGGNRNWRVRDGLRGAASRLDGAAISACEKG